jgi:hypothetical protein
MAGNTIKIQLSRMKVRWAIANVVEAMTTAFRVILRQGRLTRRRHF